jgi:hypothetical protein
LRTIAANYFDLGVGLEGVAQRSAMKRDPWSQKSATGVVDCHLDQFCHLVADEIARIRKTMSLQECDELLPLGLTNVTPCDGLSSVKVGWMSRSTLGRCMTGQVG